MNHIYTFSFCAAFFAVLGSCQGDFKTARYSESDLEHIDYQ